MVPHAVRGCARVRAVKVLPPLKRHSPLLYKDTHTDTDRKSRKELVGRAYIHHSRRLLGSVCVYVFGECTRDPGSED